MIFRKLLIFVFFVVAFAPVMPTYAQDEVVIYVEGNCTLTEVITLISVGSSLSCIGRADATKIVLTSDITMTDIAPFSLQSDTHETAFGAIDITRPITIDGAGHTIVVDNSFVDMAFFDIVPAADVTLMNITLSGGVASTRSPGTIGGSIVNQGKLTIVNSRLENASADYGGSIFNTGELTISNTQFKGNSATRGGCIYNQGILKIDNTLFENNSATITGGCLFHGESSLQLSQSTLSGNSSLDPSGGFGGAIVVGGGTATIENSTLSGNIANYGGGIYVLLAGSVKLRSSTLYGNSAYTDGGGIFIGAMATGDQDFEAVYTDRLVAGDFQLSIENTIITASQGGECAGQLFDQVGTERIYTLTTLVEGKNNLIGTGRFLDSASLGPCYEHSVGIVTQIDPLLTQNTGTTPTHALLSDSNAVDTGEAVPSSLDSWSEGGCPDVDQRGVSRSSTCDIGAFEYIAN